VSVGRSLLDASQFRTDNIANARARGVELALTARGASGLEAAVTYTFLDTEVLAVDGLRIAPQPFRVGDPLLRRPRHQGMLRFGIARRALSAFVALHARGRVLDVDPSFGAFGGLVQAPGYTVVDASISRRIGRGVEVFARLDNALDREYEEVLGFPALGRGVLMGIGIATGR
jgi:vitamin B12 transporter